ncbi:MAG: hypothetical protein E2590_08505 [Chryseobacterium sp.]|nr:hypothetical protein [Chryseobacterium sp.]
MKIIAKDSSNLEINFFNKVSPDSSDSNDSKWINVELIIKLNGFTAHQYLQLYEDDILSFIETINLFNRGDSQVVEFNNMEEFFHLKGINIESEIHWEGYSIYPIGNGNKLEFKFITSENDLELMKNDLISDMRMINI